jgi:NAD(P)-dependent dehydrogenase (short-subunit alcohol dehydrogenase family)
MQISSNVFIVTGGASGLGGATSRMLAAQGGKVVIADVQADRGEALARELGAATRFVKCDVASEADGRAAVEAATALGPLRGLVNCAGIAIGEKTIG